ncbi:28S ribosomal protein S16, mitochondrial-like [Pecten maximus]|uniref:28S ribosomal protein S16, mitochondrial-like n=1 Tax=Pecten maximus TaxID=6579 RepID=UPI001458EF35|nr:28S ribosomal protein S16, mitochondrial-like [Pecten maximus]
MDMPRLVDRSKNLVIRLALHGCTNRPFFHIVLTRNRSPRNARPLAQLGTYDPLPNTNNERLSGCLPIHPLTYLAAHRATKKLSKSAEESSTEPESDNEDV